MAVRPIDGDALIEWFSPYLHTGEPIPADVVIEDIRSMPTLTPPNEWVSNGDKFRTMRDEDMARELGRPCPKGNTRECDKRCSQCWLEWLQQPVEEYT